MANVDLGPTPTPPASRRWLRAAALVAALYGPVAATLYATEQVKAHDGVLLALIAMPCVGAISVWAIAESTASIAAPIDAEVRALRVEVRQLHAAVNTVLNHARAAEEAAVAVGAAADQAAQSAEGAAASARDAERRADEAVDAAFLSGGQAVLDALPAGARPAVVPLSRGPVRQSQARSV